MARRTRKPIIKAISLDYKHNAAFRRRHRIIKCHFASEQVNQSVFQRHRKNASRTSVDSIPRSLRRIHQLMSAHVVRFPNAQLQLPQGNEITTTCNNILHYLLLNYSDLFTKRWSIFTNNKRSINITQLHLIIHLLTSRGNQNTQH